MPEVMLGWLILIWDLVKPAVIGGFYMFCFVFFIKYLVLDGITEKLNDAVRHLSAIERTLERVDLGQVVRRLEAIESEIDRTRSYVWEAKNSINSIEKKITNSTSLLKE